MSVSRAARFRQYGDKDVLLIEEVQIPEIGPRQVLVRVHAAGLNPLDMKLRSGALREYVPLELPVTLGAELVGTIEKIGSSIAEFTIGQRVIAVTGGVGAFADYAAVDAEMLAVIPDALDDTTASAVPLASLTSWQALFEHGGLEKGATVLIHGASGGLGGIAIQLAAQAGAEVIGTASEDALNHIRDLGAARAIDYHDLEQVSGLRDIDLVVDLAGKGYEQLWPSLTADGRFVTTVRGDIGDIAPSSVRAAFIQMHPDSVKLANIAERAASGELRFPVARTYAFEQVAEAVEKMTEGQPGKAVLKIA